MDEPNPSNAGSDAPAEDVKKTEDAGSAGKGRSILIVEDEKPLSHALKLKLSHEGYEVTVAGDGEEGVNLALEKQFDLILIDIIMPKMDGFMLLNKLREAGNKTTIIVLSNLGQKEDIEKAKQLGAVEYMVKSNTPISRIVTAVNAFLQ
jgi:two-component system, OmpR family, alkaline phosphatase synthesis response regulator PhoP